MKRLLTAVTCVVFLALLFQGVAYAQQATSGDKKLDGYLKQMNKQGEQDPEGFIRHLSETYGVPHEELRQAREQHRLTYGDTYMAAAIAKRSQKRVGDVAAQFRQQQGQGQSQGWGVVAQQNGVKPGSPQFHQMKNQAKGSVSKLKAQNRHRMRMNEQNQNQEKNRGEGQDQGQGKGQGKGKDQGKGQSQGKGKGGKK